MNVIALVSGILASSQLLENLRVLSFHNDSTNAEKRVVGKLSYIYRKPSKQEQDKTSNNRTYKQRNKENIKAQKKSLALITEE